MSLPRCDRRVLRRDLPGHKATDCMSAPVDCEDCKARMKRCDLASHRANHCPSRSVECNWCGCQTEFRHREYHMRYECPEREVQCDKCRKSMRLSRLPSHKEQHLRMVRKITVRKCKYIDRITFEYFDGTSDSAGEYGGGDEVRFTLAEDEYIEAFKIWTGAKLDAIRFETNKRYLDWVKGYGAGGHEEEYRADSGMCIVSFERNGGESGRITRYNSRAIPN